MDSMTTGGVRRSRRAGALCLFLVTAVAAVLAGCGSSAESGADGDGPSGSDRTPTAVSAASLSSGDAVPAPPGDVALTFTGKVSGDNAGRTVALDLETVATMGQIKVEVFDPWAERDLTFTGVELEDVLAVVGVDPGATSLHVTALDDYQVDITLAEVREGGIVLATSTGGGRPLAVAKGGPTRIVFVDDVEAGAAAEQWIWSIDTIDVR